MCNSENSFVKGKSWSAFVGVAIAERVLNWFIGVYRGFMCFQYELFWLYVVEYMVSYFMLFPNKCDFIPLLMRPWQTPQKYVQNIWPNVCEWLCMHIDRLNLSIAMMFYWKILQIPARLPEMVGGTIYRNPSFLGRNKTWISVDILLTPIHWPNRTRPSTFWPEVKGHRRHGASQCQKKEQVEDAWSSFYPVKNREYCIPEWFIYQTKMVPGICWNMLQEDVEETPCDNPSSEHSDLAPTLSLWGIVFSPGQC